MRGVLGGEARYLRAGGSTSAPPLTRFGSKAFTSAAWNVQVSEGATISQALDLTNFERHQAKVRFGFEF